MLRFYAFAVTALSASLLISCERSAQPVSKAPVPESPQIPPQVSTSAELPAASASVEPAPSDSVIVSDTVGSHVTAEDLRAVRSALEARLRLDEFTASGPAARYGNACRFYDTTLVRRYTTDDVRFAYVRPRLIKISVEGEDLSVRQVNATSAGDLRVVEATAEVTRLVLWRQGVDGKWKGAADVSRDTVSFLVSSSVADSRWTVCEKPAHANGRNRDGVHNPFDPWLPVRASEMERMPVAWDEHFDAEKLRQLADSVSKLPASFVVEGNRPPSVPMVIKGVCPFEGCEFGEWLTCDTLRVFTEASDTATPAFMLHREERFSALTGDVHIMQAGMVVFHRNVPVDDPVIDLVFTFTPADTLYPLLHKGEGFGRWYFRGKARDGDFFFGSGDEVESRPEEGYSVVRPMKSVWWVKLRTKDGREGWFVPGQGIHGTAPYYEPLPNACPIKGAG